MTVQRAKWKRAMTGRERFNAQMHDEPDYLFHLDLKAELFGM